jgi:hypothetical protein
MGGARRAGRYAIQIRGGPELIEKVARASENFFLGLFINNIL